MHAWQRRQAWTMLSVLCLEFASPCETIVPDALHPPGLARHQKPAQSSKHPSCSRTLLYTCNARTHNITLHKLSVAS